MIKSKPWKAILCVLTAGVALSVAPSARAEGLSFEDSGAPVSDSWAGHWLVRLEASYLLMEDGLNRAFVTPGAAALPLGAPIPGTDADISNQIIPALDISYFLTNNLAIGAICCVTQHDVTAKGLLGQNINGAVAALTGTGRGGDLGSTWAVPATVLFQYHLHMDNGIKPYIGAGPTYAFFVDEEVGRGLSTVASKLKVDDEWGFTLQAGADVALGGRWFLNADVKKMFLETDATWTGKGPLAGGKLVAKDLDLSPWIFSLGIGHKF